MMTAEKHIPVEMRTLFGSYIMKMNEVPGRHVTKEDKAREQKCLKWWMIISNRHRSEKE